MNKSAAGLPFLLVVATACGSDGSAAVTLDPVDRSVDPCVDFYQFACGDWSRRHPVRDASSYEKKALEALYAAVPKLQQIIEEAASGLGRADHPHAALVGAYYTSCLGAPQSASSVPLVRTLLARIDALGDRDGLVRQAAQQPELGSTVFVHLFVGIDPGDATRYVVGLAPGGWELPDRSLYLDADQAGLRARYREHIEALNAIVGGAPLDADAAIRVETALALGALPRDERRDPTLTHHPMTVDQLVTRAPGFPWRSFLEAAGFSGLERIEVIEPAFLETVGRVFESTSLADLKSYLRWQLLQDLAPSLTQAVLEEDLRFWGRLSGQMALQEREWTCFQATLGSLGDAVAQPYLARHFDDRIRADVEAMAVRIRAALARRLVKEAWLDEPTRQQALAKLDQLLVKVARPADEPSYPGLTLDPDSFLENRIQLRKRAIDRSRARLTEAVDRTAWSVSPLVLNAFFSFNTNGVTLPAILLSPPFLARGGHDAVNFGALGSVIGHELSHGFDDAGRHFDGSGTLRDWWTPDAATVFSQRAQCVIDQFGAYRAAPDTNVHVDGALTVGENIADLGGVRLAYDALFDGSPHDQRTGDLDARQLFFLGYAQTHCENVRTQLASTRARTDPHAPGWLRVNGPLSNLPEFATAFQCANGAPMARATRCEVW